MSGYLFKATVNEYLEGLPESVQARLYRSPATSLSIYRLLPSIAKFYVMSMVFNEKPVLLRDLDKWIKPMGRKLQIESLKRMRALHLIKEEQNGMVLILNPIFRNSLRDALTGGQSHNTFGVLCTTEDNHKVDIEFLDNYASNKWETILHFMVGTPSTAYPSDGVLSLLKHGGLMDGGSPSYMKITNEGFQFLLQDVNAQIWALLLQYLRMAESLQMDPVDVLNFIFMLGSLELGKDYSLSALSDTQVSMLEDLRDYGLVYQRKSSSRRFYPTRLATTLTSDSVALKTPSNAMNQSITEASTTADEQSGNSTTESGSYGSIIIETNFKLYAYTTSPLQIAVLNLFVHMKTRFANMVTGQITRESIRHALVNGITAEQIIAFLEAHAHSQMRRLAEEKLDKKIEYDTNNNNTDNLENHKLEILPPTVIDQIKLWQLELDRIQTVEGYLFKDFANQQEYEVLSVYAEEIGVLLWSDKTKKRFFVTKDGNSQVVEFANRKLRRQKK